MHFRKIKRNTWLRTITLISALFSVLIGSSQGRSIVDASNSPYYILNDTTIEVGDSMIVGPGAEIFIGDHVNIQVKGYLEIKGSPQARAFIKPVTPGVGWGEFKIYIEVDSLIIENAVVEDGRFLSFHSANYYKNVTFINNQNLAWNGAISRFILGKLHVEDCKVYGSNRGEGFLCHSIDTPIVINSYFESIPDAIEYLNCEGGRIGNCQFFDMKDDAIDLNHCNKTVIDSNLIVNVGDRGMEIGSENNGSSTDIHVYRNVLVDCKVGVNFKEGSTGLIENNTFFRNSKAITSLASGRPDTGSTIRIVNCIFDENGIPIFKDSVSNFTVNYSSSSTSILDGIGNIFAIPQFVDTTNLNFNLNVNSKCIDAGIENGKYDSDGTRIDMGAFSYSQTFQPTIIDEIEIRPNPVKEELLIWSSELFDLIRVYDNKGVLKIEKHATGTNHFNFLSINVSGLSRGMYIVYVEKGEKVSRKKFIKL